MTQVFISYSRRDLDFVEQLAADLKAAGLKVWYDLSGLEGGARWSREIEKAIRESQYVLVVLSPDSVASKWVEEEFLYASELGKKIIPLFYKQCALPFGYRTLHFIDVQENKYKQKFGEILRSLDVKPVEKKKTHQPEENFPPGWDETWQPSFERTKSANKKSEDSQRQSIKSESKVEKLKSKGKPIQQRWIIFPVVLVLIGVVFAGVFGLPKLFLFPENTPEPTLTLTEDATQEPALTMTTTVTAESSATPAKAITPTAPPLPIEITDDFGVEMVLVSAGEFTMGRYGYATTPIHTVYLDTFYIDKYEITNYLYKACVDAGVCQSPSNFSSETRPHYYENSEFDSYPVIYVDWEKAKIYCEWRGAQLPTEAQWEKAARGTDERTYPWGENINNTYANYNNNIGDTISVGSYEIGKSPYGVYDMAGNVLEWVFDWGSDTYYKNSPYLNPPGPNSGEFRVLRGGSWNFDEYNQEVITRLQFSPNVTNSIVGFRCARDVTP